MTQDEREVKGACSVFDLTSTWKPSGDQVLVFPLTATSRLASNLIIAPDAHRERPHTGIVLAVGPGLLSPYFGGPLPIGVQVGQLVAFGKYAGMDFVLDQTQVILIRDMELLAYKEAGAFELVQHRDKEMRLLAVHEAGELCDQCPELAPSPIVLAERARILKDNRLREALADGPTGLSAATPHP